MRTTLRGIAAMLLLTIATGCTGEPARVMTFNVLCPVCDVGTYPPWPQRVSAFEDLFERHQPDLLGAQELLNFGNVEEILEILPTHDVVRADPAGPDGLSYPDSMIFYRRDRYEVLDSGFYWLSQRPDEGPYPAWDISLPRIVVWARLLDRAAERELIFINTHFDNNGPNKVPSANLFMDRAGIGAALPIIVTGDFNSTPDSPSYAILADGNDGPGGFDLDDAFDLTTAPPRIDSNTGLDEAYACQGTGPRDFPDCRIDHVFVGGGADFLVTDWVADLHQYGRDDDFPSDHRAIQATIESSRPRAARRARPVERVTSAAGPRVRC